MVYRFSWVYSTTDTLGLAWAAQLVITCPLSQLLPPLNILWAVLETQVWLLLNRSRDGTGQMTSKNRYLVGKKLNR